MVKLPPPPFGGKADDERPRECDALGRKRQRPHQEGDFATLVYVPVGGTSIPSEEGEEDDEFASAVWLRDFSQKGRDVLERLVARQEASLSSSTTLSSQSCRPSAVRKKVHAMSDNKSSRPVDGSSARETSSPTKRPRKPSLPSPTADDCAGRDRGEDSGDGELHMSLSQSLVLRHHFIAPFVEKLKAAVSGVPCFEIYFSTSRVDVFCNATRDRYFSAAVLLSKHDSAKMDELIDQVDEVVRAFKFPTFAMSPGERRPHVSVAWTPESLSCKLNSLTSSNSEDRRPTWWGEVDAALEAEEESMLLTGGIAKHGNSSPPALLRVDCVCVKVGKKILKLPLHVPAV